MLLTDSSHPPATDGTDWKEQARALHAANPDLSFAEIGRRVGRNHGTVWKALHPERAAELQKADNAKRRAAKREWDRTEKAHEGVRRRERQLTYRAVCERCGDPCGIGSKGEATLCKGCDNERRKEGRAVLLDRVEALYRDGATYKAIAEALGRSRPESVCDLVNELLRTGRIEHRRQRPNDA